MPLAFSAYIQGHHEAVEVKLGMAIADAGAKSLNAFADNIDTNKTSPPAALLIVTGNGFAHRRADGIYAAPIQTLQP
jgi:hypothetical protein